MFFVLIFSAIMQSAGFYLEFLYFILILPTAKMAQFWAETTRIFKCNFQPCFPFFSYVFDSTIVAGCCFKNFNLWFLLQLLCIALSINVNNQSVLRPSSFGLYKKLGLHEQRIRFLEPNSAADVGHSAYDSYATVLKKNAVRAFRRVAEVSRIKCGSTGKFVKISPPIFRRITFATRCGLSENLERKYSQISSKMNVVSEEIRQLSNVHTAFFLCTAVGPDFFPSV